MLKTITTNSLLNFLLSFNFFTRDKNTLDQMGYYIWQVGSDDVRHFFCKVFSLLQTIPASIEIETVWNALISLNRQEASTRNVVLVLFIRLRASQLLITVTETSEICGRQSGFNLIKRDVFGHCLIGSPRFLQCRSSVVVCSAGLPAV